MENLPALYHESRLMASRNPFTPDLQTFNLRQEHCDDVFLKSFSGLSHFSNLLKGLMSMLSPLCFIKNRGARLKTLVWEQDAAPRTQFEESRFTRTRTRGALLSSVPEICKEYPQLRDPRLAMDVDANGEYRQLHKDLCPVFVKTR